MTAGQTGFRRFFPLFGMLFLAIGLIVFFAQVHPFASNLSDRLAASADELGGFLPAAFLTANHAAQAWAFDRANVLSALRDMLLSCWPVILVLFGAALLSNALAPKNAVATSAGGNH
jgi:hypothetical protein